MRGMKEPIAATCKLSFARNPASRIFAKGAVLSLLKSFLFMKVLTGYVICVAARLFV